MAEKKNTIITKLQKFFIYDLWQPDTKKKLSYRMLIRPLRIFFITFKGFIDNKVQIRASALTYNSILSIVPMFALAFGIAQGFGMQRKLEQEIIKNFDQQKEVLQYVLTFVDKMLSKVQGGLIAGVGVVLLIFSVMQVLGNVERAFNDIWMVKKARRWHRMFTDYISIMLIAPILLLISSSLTVYLTVNIKKMMAAIHLPSLIEWFIQFGFDLIPYAILWSVFTFIYIVFPNTKVKFKSGLIAGIIAGTTFQIVQWAYFKFQIKLSNYGAIYGSFAALPLFMVWLQTSWIIVLFGAELSYAVQNLENFENESNETVISQRQKQLLALLMMNHLVKNFESGEKAETLAQICIKLDMPVRLATDIAYELEKAGLITEIVPEDETEENPIQPAISTELITIQYVLDKMNHLDESNVLQIRSQKYTSLQSTLLSFDHLISQNESNILLKDF